MSLDESNELNGVQMSTNKSKWQLNRTCQPEPEGNKEEVTERPERHRREGQRFVQSALHSMQCIRPMILPFCVFDNFFYLYVLCGSMWFYVFCVGLVKLHCGATPPSVMVLFYMSREYRMHGVCWQSREMMCALWTGKGEWVREREKEEKILSFEPTNILWDLPQMELRHTKIRTGKPKSTKLTY